ncbi:RNA methyltransferase [Phosphitispora sp. TUW77]|uniref:RNA methyltransferase n=1 Tax=Phosphitispora sp. TUW77 TaxID=3152361 RepID=UPI003AB73E8E
MDVISTSVTNLDIHDIARISCTYDVRRYYVIHPLDTQRKLIQDILNYWQKGYGATYNSDRKAALDKVALIQGLEETKEEIRKETGFSPTVVTTDARVYPNTVTFRDLRQKLRDGSPYLILFGTGWGIEKQTMLECDYILEPVYGPGDYNHLSVRSAVAIILDRLLGEVWWSR